MNLNDVQFFQNFLKDIETVIGKTFDSSNVTFETLSVAYKSTPTYLGELTIYYSPKNVAPWKAIYKGCVDATIYGSTDPNSLRAFKETVIEWAKDDCRFNINAK